MIRSALVRSMGGRGLADSVQAGKNLSNLARNYITYGASTGASARPIGASVSGSPQHAVKPFPNANTGGSSVTPYLGLSSPFTAPDTTYYTQIRPAMEQQKALQQQMQQNARLQSQLAQMAAKPPFDLHGSTTIAPTGHAAVYQNMLGYYPQIQPRQKR